jgi:hypothetical protein
LIDPLIFLITTHSLFRVHPVHTVSVTDNMQHSQGLMGLYYLLRLRDASGLILSMPRFEFFIFIFIAILQNIWFATNFAKIYVCRRGPQRQGQNGVAHGGKSRQEWALSVGQTWRHTPRR